MIWRLIPKVGLRPNTRSMSRKTRSDYCLDLVQKADYERYLALLLLPSSLAKTSAFSVGAFNVQIAQVFESTTDRNITQMRLQFWLNTLDSIYEGVPPEQPVAQELARAVTRHNLNKHWLKRLVQGRFEYLKNRPFDRLEDVESYAEKTVSSFYYLILEILGIKDVHCDHAASHIGKAHGLVTLLRGVPYLGAKGEIHVPMHSLLEHGVSEEDILRGSKDQKVKDIFYAIASSAHGHLEKARSLKKNVPKNAHSVFLCTVSIENYLNSLQKADFDVFDGKLRQRNTMLPLQLMMRSWKGGF